MDDYEEWEQGFDSLLKSKEAEIRKLARSQRVPGLDRDEVASELRMTLWKAWSNWDVQSGVTIGQFWWVIWTNRKIDLVNKFFAQRRIQDVVPLGPEDIEAVSDAFGNLISADHIPPCPTDGELDRKMWALIAQGYNGKEIRSLLGIGIRRFYKVIDAWKNEEVYGALTFA